MIAVVLAAGRSRRMGYDKAEIVVDGATLLDRAIAAVARYPTYVVVPSRLARTRPGVVTVTNDESERGMTHSLRCALAAAERTCGTPDGAVVTLVDTPLVDAALVDAVVRGLAGADVAYPRCGDRRGHPVAFSRRALELLPRLDEGDTLRGLRDDPRLVRSPLTVDAADERPFLDVDDPAALRAFLGRPDRA